METLVIKKKEEQEHLQDVVAYLLQLCRYMEEGERKIFCLDAAEKALFVYNLNPKAFGQNKSLRQGWLDNINYFIEKYSNNDSYHL